MRNKGIALAAFLGGVASIAMTGTASAQTTPTATTPSAESNADVGDEIVVTARKRGESLTDAPLAIVALDDEQLAQRNIRSLSDLQNFTPGFRMQESSSGGATRGFSAFTTRGIFPGGDSPDRQVVSIFIDGIAVGGGGAVPGLTDIAQVEVINGPQSAYFGRSTFAGAVNLVTRTPGDELRGSVEGSLWSYGSREIRGQIEGPIVEDVLFARISARDWKQGPSYESFGYGNDLGERSTKSVAGTLYFTPAPELRVKAFGTYWVDQDGPPAQGLLLASDWNCNARASGTGTNNYICGGIGSAPANRIAQPPLPQEVITRLRQANTVLGSDFQTEQGFRREAYFASLAADYDLTPGLTLSANGMIGENDWTNIIDLANRYQAPGRYSSFIVPYDINNHSAEVRLASDANRTFSFLIGGNYYHQDVTFSSNGMRDGTFRPGAAPTYSTTDTWGVFGSVSVTPVEKLTVSLEGRYQSDKIMSQSLSAGSPEVGGTTNSFVPRAIVRYEVTDRANVYASYAEGTRPAQFNANVYALPQSVQQQLFAQADLPLQVPEERLKMGEIGFKGDLLDRKLTLLLAGYYGFWSDRQVQQTLSYLNPGVTQIPVVTPSGRVRLYGVEAQAQLRPVTGVTLEGTYAYAETDIRNTSCSECATITGVTNPVGNRLPRYPARTATASASYEAPAFLGLTGYARVDYTYTGKMYAEESNVVWLDPAHRVNYRAGVRNDNVFAELFVTNLFDDKTPLSISRNVDTYLATNTISLAAAQRRMIGVRLGHNF